MVCAVGIVGFILILWAILKSKRPIKEGFYSILQGIIALFAVNVTGALTGITIGVNIWSILCSCIAGAPGVILLLLLKLLWAA